MSLPTYDQFMLPLLKLAAEGEQVHAIATLREQLTHQLGITPEQRAIRLPSGQQSVFDNRIGWANTYLRKAGLLSRPKRGYVQITPRGRDVLAESPTAIDNLYLQRFDEFREFRERSATEEPLATTPNATPASTTTPEETIDLLPNKNSRRETERAFPFSRPVKLPLNRSSTTLLPLT